MTAKIIAFDPGGCTGVAFLEPNGTVHCSQINTDRHHKRLYNLLEGFNPDVVVCESFLYQHRAKVELIPVEYIGVIHLWCLQHEVILTRQSASQGKKFWTDDKLKKAKLYEPGLPHAMDAMRHLLYYITFTLNDSTILKLVEGEKVL